MSLCIGCQAGWFPVHRCHHTDCTCAACNPHQRVDGTIIRCTKHDTSREVGDDAPCWQCESEREATRSGHGVPFPLPA